MTGTLTPTRPSEPCGGSGCGSYRPGHDTHWIQARLVRQSDDVVPVSLSADGAHAVRLAGERVDAVGTRTVDVVGRHHDAERLARAVALAADGGEAVFDVARHALRVSEPGGERALVLNLELGDETDTDEWDESASESAVEPAPDAVDRG
ncbi:hypothetical protein [Actinomyces radicidentis]|uniref:hypothetical protein n=1 Tax=Actinomyces radicidentis TaxID=111015 RepID=UPI000AE82859|nr:hypothetical protein [Actinomyces radicidentis]